MDWMDACCEDCGALALNILACEDPDETPPVL